MNDDQYAAVACQCDLEKHSSDVPHRCSHGEWESYGAWERGETPSGN